MRPARYAVLLILLLALAAVNACGPLTSTVVVLNREYYSPDLNPAEFRHLRGQRILFGSIEDKSTNTENLSFYNPEQTVRYKLYYSASQNSMAQPVVSFFWYALKKGFEQAGVNIVENGPLYDAELYMIITSLTDEEIQFTALFTKVGIEPHAKNYVVRIAGDKTTDPVVLEDRAYSMLDAIVKAILSDVEALLSGLSPDTIRKMKSSLAAAPNIVPWQPLSGTTMPSPLDQAASRYKVLLPNNEEIWDLNGVWDAEYQFYGRESHRGFRQVRFNIVQHGRQFEARLTGDYSILRSVAVTGELFKDGFKNAMEHTGAIVKMKGEIAEKGKVMLFDNGETFRLKCTRK